MEYLTIIDPKHQPFKVGFSPQGPDFNIRGTCSCGWKGAPYKEQFVVLLEIARHVRSAHSAARA